MKIIPTADIDRALYAHLVELIGVTRDSPETLIRTLAYVLAAVLVSPDVNAEESTRLEAVALQDIRMILLGGPRPMLRGGGP